MGVGGGGGRRDGEQGRREGEGGERGRVIKQEKSEGVDLLIY